MMLHYRIKWKINNFSSSTPIHRLLCSKRLRKFVQTSYAQKLQFIGHIYVHSVTHGQLWKPQHTHVMSLVRKSHLKMNWSFAVIEGRPYIGVSRNSERCVVVMCNNVNLISETYEDLAMGKLQLCWFQPPNSGLKTLIWEMLWNIYK